MSEDRSLPTANLEVFPCEREPAFLQHRTLKLTHTDPELVSLPAAGLVSSFTSVARASSRSAAPWLGARGLPRRHGEITTRDRSQFSQRTPIRKRHLRLHRLASKRRCHQVTGCFSCSGRSVGLRKLGITDANGNFDFPAVLAWTYYIFYAPGIRLSCIAAFTILCLWGSLAPRSSNTRSGCGS